MSPSTPEEFARTLDVMARRAMTYDSATISDTYRLDDLIAERDEQVRADERARVSVVHSTLTDEQLVDELVRRGVLREEVVPAFHGLGFTEPAVRRHVTVGKELPPDPEPTPEEIEALRRRLTGEGGTS